MKTPTLLERDAITRILHTALSTPKDLADIFFSLSPHCDSIDLCVHNGGWNRDYDEDYERFHCYVGGEGGSDSSANVFEMEKWLNARLEFFRANPRDERTRKLKSAELFESRAAALRAELQQATA